MNPRDFPLGQEVEAPADLVSVGRISGLFGVRGWVKVFSYTAPRDNILNYNTWYLGCEGRCYRAELKGGRSQGKGIVVQLAGCADRDTAARVIGVDIAVRRSLFVPLPPGQYYWSDLEGLQVMCRDGRALGVVDHVFETGAHDVLVVKGDREHLVPFVPDHVILEVDLKRRVMRVDWDPDF